MSNLIPALADINIPPHVKVQLTDSFESLMSEIGRRTMMGYAGESFFGSAFVQGERLQFTTSYADGLAGAEFIFIAVGTPTGQDGHGADLRYVESAARSIGEGLDHYAVVINKSTVPVGTGDVVANLIRQNLTRPDVRFAVVSNPEFLREGAAVQDFFQPDRIVLGSTERDAAKKRKNGEP